MESQFYTDNSNSKYIFIVQVITDISANMLFIIPAPQLIITSPPLIVFVFKRPRFFLLAIYANSPY